MLLEKLDILNSKKALKMTFWKVISYLAKQDKKLKIWLLTSERLKKVISGVIQKDPKSLTEAPQSNPSTTNGMAESHIKNKHICVFPLANNKDYTPMAPVSSKNCLGPTFLKV